MSLFTSGKHIISVNIESHGVFVYIYYEIFKTLRLIASAILSILLSGYLSVPIYFLFYLYIYIY